MNQIYWRDLKLIRNQIEADQYFSVYNEQMFVSIVLPEPCDKETFLYAANLCVALQKVNVNATISETLFLSGNQLQKQNYEVRGYHPLGTICINVYTGNVVKKLPCFVQFHHFFFEFKFRICRLAARYYTLR